MFAQLGSIVFSGAFAPETFQTEGDEAVYAQHERVNGKPRLQSTGSTLQELTLSIKLNANFCKPKEQLTALRTARDNHEVLPLLMGNGEYIKDYVIVSCNAGITEAFPDGSVLEYQVELKLLEHVSTSRLDQKKLAAKKQAFAVGDKQPVISTRSQPLTPVQTVGVSISSSISETEKLDGLITEYQNNPSTRPITENRIKATCLKAQDSLKNTAGIIEGFADLKARSSEILAESAHLERNINRVKALVPPDNIKDLMDAGVSLAAARRKFKKASNGLMSDIIVRR